MERLVVISALVSPRHHRQSPIDLQHAEDGSNVQSEVWLRSDGRARHHDEWWKSNLTYWLSSGCVVLFFVFFFALFVHFSWVSVICWVSIMLFDAHSSGSVHQVGFSQEKNHLRRWGVGKSLCRCKGCRSGDPVEKQGGTASNWIGFNLLTCDFNQVGV